MTTGIIDWSAAAVLVASPYSSTSFVGSFPIDTNINGSSAEATYVMALQYNTAYPTSNPAYIVINIYKSSDAGATWGTNIPVMSQNVDSSDGYVVARDLPMLNYHVTCDPSASSSYVYAFYVRNESTAFVQGLGRRNALYCKTSTNGGVSWNGEVQIYTLDHSNYPTAGWADVPANSSGNTVGMFRIGRVWGCVDPNGSVYVCWMDNRYGKYGSTDRDYWHVHYSKSTDSGAHWTTPVRISAPSYTSLSDILTNASVGGYGTPIDHWMPPGDFLTCDADSSNLYVAWPDTRSHLASSVYVNTIPNP